MKMDSLSGRVSRSDEQHTPGPWDCEVREFAKVKWDGIIRPKGKRDPICSVFMAGYAEREAAANAHLIAAAPTMLEALKECFGWLAADEEEGVPDPANLRRELMNRIRAAIARAKGLPSDANSTAAPLAPQEKG